MNDELNIRLPDFLEADELPETRQGIFYNNKEKDFYVTLLQENKESLKLYNLPCVLNLYFDSTLKQTSASMISVTNFSNPVFKETNGIKIMYADAHGKIKNEEVACRLAVLETAQSFFRVFIWFPKEDQEKYPGVCDSILSLNASPSP